MAEFQILPDYQTSSGTDKSKQKDEKVHLKSELIKYIYCLQEENNNYHIKTKLYGTMFRPDVWANGLFIKLGKGSLP